MTSPDPVLPVNEVMDELRARVRARLREDIARTHPESPLLAPGIFDEAEAILQRAVGTERPVLMPELLIDADVALRTSLRFSSHRPVAGGPILWMKRRVLLPVFRWLYEYSRDNFARQAKMNDTLMASIETLVVEVVRLRREAAELRQRLTPAPPSGQ